MRATPLHHSLEMHAQMGELGYLDSFGILWHVPFQGHN